MSKYIYIFERTITIDTSPATAATLREQLNLHHLGDKECNTFDLKEREYKPKYPNKETAKFKQSHYNCGMSFQIKLKFGLRADGKVEAIDQIKFYED